MLEKFLEKTELVARLLQEARLASAIGHENIVDVTDFGTTADGRSYVVMEFLEGESLAQVVIRDAPLAVDRCLRIARQVVSALVAAHDKGIVHRDIKPENVFLLRRGEQDFVKVVDFGVSKAVRTRDDGAETAAADPHRDGAGDAAVHVARAGPRRRRRRRARRRLGGGRDAVRVPDRRGPVPGQQLPGRHLPGADPGGAAAVASCAPSWASRRRSRRW